MKASAPGKLFLFGEYVALDGHPALIAAVNRRVYVSFSSHQESGLWVRGSLSKEPIRVEGLSHPFGRAFAGAEAARQILGQAQPLSGVLTIDSSELYDRATRRKLGFGSSAAVVVAVATAMLGEAPSAKHFALLRDLHNQAQGSNGSGGDIAASLLGGVTWLEQGSVVRTLADTSLLRLFIHEQSADTPSFSKKVRAFKEAEPAGYAVIERQLVEAARLGRDALRHGPLAIPAVSLANQAMSELSLQAEVPIVTPAHRELVAWAKTVGGAAKPAGAGGGDLSLVALPSAGYTSDRAPTLHPLDVAEHGARIE